MYKHILLPTDGSSLSAMAVKQGIKFAKAVGAKITAINVTPEYQMMIDEGFVMPTVMSIRERFERETTTRSRKLLDEITSDAQAAGVACVGVTMVSGVPYEAIIKQAKKSKCDMIMMASHGRKGLSSILLGSETAKVLTHSTIPVLVVR